MTGRSTAPRLEEEVLAEIMLPKPQKRLNRVDGAIGVRHVGSDLGAECRKDIESEVLEEQRHLVSVVLPVVAPIQSVARIGTLDVLPRNPPGDILKAAHVRSGENEHASWPEHPLNLPQDSSRIDE